uniref:Uncharacterized protein n=1 Tax=Sphaeramia orbicularis TaxID=375764 RepID=A0A673BCI3_9TELE
FHPDFPLHLFLKECNMLSLSSLHNVENTLRFVCHLGDIITYTRKTTDFCFKKEQSPLISGGLFMGLFIPDNQKGET